MLAETDQPTRTVPPPPAGATGDEAALVERAQAGDDAAFDALYRHYRPRLLKFVLFSTWGNVELAEDILQDVFVKAWLALPNTAPGLRFQAWLYRIAWRQCIDDARRRQVRQRLRAFGAEALNGLAIAVDTDPLCDPERALAVDDAGGVAAEVRAVLDGLPPRHGELLAQTALEGRSYREAAAQWGTTIGSVKSRLFRARHEFRAAWAARAAGATA
jgi:RNA polymerase sigma-70 factor (ECF subfamily)